MAEPVQGPTVLILSEDDDVAEPLAAILRRGGFRAGIRAGREGVEELRAAPPDVLILDRDLSRESYQAALAVLEQRSGSASFPLLVLGGGARPPLPRGWHEDAWMALPRAPHAGEVLARVEALRRLAFYRPYRDLVHDLSQPVMTLHALSRTIARLPAPDEASRAALDRLIAETERLMTLVEEFQRRRAAASTG